jgi:hypothetical protein
MKIRSARQTQKHRAYLASDDKASKEEESRGRRRVNRSDLAGVEQRQNDHLSARARRGDNGPDKVSESGAGLSRYEALDITRC